MRNINCSESWGGVRGENVDARRSGIIASLFSSPANGGKGGDVYYISECSGDLITRVAVADVRGHGQAVSDIGQWLYDALRERMRHLEGNDVLAELNALVGRKYGHRAMTTAAVVSFHGGGSHLSFSYAGHPPMFLYRQRVKRWEPVILGSQRKWANLPLGAFSNSTYDQELVRVAAGDRLFLYTDGVTEATDAEGRFFGQERLLAVLEEAAEGTPQQLKNAVRDALCQHTGGSLAHDDVTHMALEIRPPGDPSTHENDRSTLRI